MADRTAPTHIMFSYQWNSADLVGKFYDFLTRHQPIPIWMDVQGGMKEALTTSMAEGVENCRALVCFLTPEYQRSINCKKELTYASQLQRPIIPCLLGSKDDTHWKPTQWLGLTITDLLYLNFTQINEENFEQKAQELLAKIRSVLSIVPPPSSSDQLAKNEEQTDEEDELFAPASALILPSVVRQGPVLSDQPSSIVPPAHSSEGDSVIHLRNQSPSIDCQQDLYANNGSFNNSFTFSRLLLHNTSSQSISILDCTASYECPSADGNTPQWVRCHSISINPPDALMNIGANQLVVCSLTVKISLQGTPGADHERRCRAHPLLPQPLRLRIEIEDTMTKRASLIVEQVNRPLNLPTLSKLTNKLRLSESSVLAFVSADDCSTEVRYFALISVAEDGEPRVKFTFGCDLSSQRSPTWTREEVKALQRTARQEKRSEMSVHTDVFDPFIRCFARFDHNFKLQGIQVNIQTTTSSTVEVIPLPLQRIFAQSETF